MITSSAARREMETSVRLVLVIGGARSGKSEFAQSLAAKAGGKTCFVATAEAGDAEMRDRILRHRLNRPREWDTVELEGGRYLAKYPSKGRVVIMDCLTVYLSNLMAAHGLDQLCEDKASMSQRELARREKEIVREALSLIGELRQCSRLLILVTNEVGMGLVPPYRSGRYFRDLAGQLNRKLAEEADEVYLVVAGLPLCLKRNSSSLIGSKGVALNEPMI